MGALQLIPYTLRVKQNRDLARLLWSIVSLKGHGSEADFRRVGESFFDYEYLREFEAKIGTAWKLV